MTGLIEQDIRSSFDFSRREIQGQLGKRLSPLYAATGAYSFQRTKLFNIRASEEDEAWLIDRLFPQVRRSKFSGTLFRDSRDPRDLLDPSHGTQVILTGDIAARAIGSEVGFIKTYLQGFLYRQLPVPRRTILALGAVIRQSRSVVCRPTSASSPAAIPRCAASRSIGWAMRRPSRARDFRPGETASWC